LCPLVEQGERDEDCPWAAWVREFERQPGLTEALPEAIRVSIERDHADSAIQAAWGLSQNFDAGAKEEIVHAPVLTALAERFGVKVLDRQDRGVTHAGLLHTYGYLLSNLKTPYGYKRSRWVSGRLERGLGLPKASLGPDAYLLGAESTLLSQVTYLLMRVALSDRPGEWADWSSKVDSRITPALQKFVSSLQLRSVRRTAETQLLQSGESIDWVTDLVPLPSDPSGGSLLVYSMRSKAGVKLITGFPVEKNYVQPKNPTVKPRYNAWVD
jgi:hypothetical protein